jgi:hypothetical protein
VEVEKFAARWKIILRVFESSSGQITDFIGEVREFFLNRKMFSFALANNVHGNRHFL